MLDLLEDGAVTALCNKRTIILQRMVKRKVGLLCLDLQVEDCFKTGFWMETKKEIHMQFHLLHTLN